MSTKKHTVKADKASGPLFIMGPHALKAMGDQGVRDLWVSGQRGANFGDKITDRDREWAFTRVPVGYRVTFMVAEDVFEKWFTINDPRTEGADAELDLKIQRALRLINAKTSATVKSVFQEALGWERVYGWSLLVGAFDDDQALDTELREGANLKQLAVYPKTKVLKVENVEDPDDERYGEAEFYTIDRGHSNQPRVHWTRCFKLQTRPSGMSVLDPIWDPLTCLWNMLWGLAQTFCRYGPGYPVITLPGVRTPKQLQEWAETGLFDNMNARTQLIMAEGMMFDFKGAAGSSLNPQPYYMPLLENISVGTGIPEPVLRGAQAGALTGSEVNERNYFKLISAIESRCEPAVRWVIDKVLPSLALDLKDYDIEWEAGFEITERDKAATEVYLEQANNLRLNYMMVNEVRKLNNLKNDVEGGNVVPGLLKAQAQPPPTNAGIVGSPGLEIQPDLPLETGEEWLVRRFRRPLEEPK